MHISSAAIGINQGAGTEARSKHWRVHHTARLQATTFSHLVSQRQCHSIPLLGWPAALSPTSWHLPGACVYKKVLGMQTYCGSCNIICFVSHKALLLLCCSSLTFLLKFMEKKNYRKNNPTLNAQSNYLVPEHKILTLAENSDSVNPYSCVKDCHFQVWKAPGKFDYNFN